VDANPNETMQNLTAIGLTVEPTDEMQQSAYAGMPHFLSLDASALTHLNSRRASH